jgi:hypothetical protein
MSGIALVQKETQVCQLNAIDQGEGFFRLRNVNIVGFYYLFNCVACFGHSTIFMNTYFPRAYSTDKGFVGVF